MSLIERVWAKSLSLYYGRYFGRFGRHSSFQRPRLLTNPRRVEIGDNVFIRSGARIEAIDEFNGERFDPHITIGDRTLIEMDVHIAACDAVQIGHDVVIAGGVFISDHNHQFLNPDRPVMRQGLVSPGPVIIADQVWVGEGAMILPGVTIGRHAVVGAHAVVTKDVPELSVVAGVPAKIISWYDAASKQWKRVKHDA